MLEIPWFKVSPIESHCKLSEWLLKRKKRGNDYTYEVWRNGELDKNNLGYFDILKEYRDILRVLERRR